MRGAKTLAVLFGATILASAPAAWAQSHHAPGDPWEGLNRFGYAVQGALDKVIIHPLATIFRHLSPGPIGEGLHNVIVNLSEPNAFINDVLQLRLKRASIPAARFVTNSTVGILGLFDVAGHVGLPHHDNEFGVTLGRYGVGPGPYMFVPLIGPTTVRDLAGSGIDIFIDPMHWLSYASRPEISTARAIVGGLDLRVKTEGQLNALLSDATDPYATLRSVYLQNKESEVRGDSAPIEALPTFDEPPAVPVTPATAGATPVEDAPPPPPDPDPEPTPPAAAPPPG
jgi:phospholipid-binding lipoprotein MlaA